MSPKVSLPKGGELGKDMDERQGVEEGRSTGRGESWGVETSECGRADRAELSAREAIVEEIREQGAQGLQHGVREAGRTKPRRRKFRKKVLGLVRRKYGGEAGERFGPTLAAEHLESDDGLKVDPETLRRWMLAEGLWSRQRKRKQHRRRRERKEHFGELVQMDGSFHEWLPASGAEAVSDEHGG